MATTQSSEIVEEGGEKVYVAVGKSVAKAGALLQWCFRTFVGSEICILHVHKPSPLIPTLRQSLSFSISYRRIGEATLIIKSLF